MSVFDACDSCGFDVQDPDSALCDACALLTCTWDVAEQHADQDRDEVAP